MKCMDCTFLFVGKISKIDIVVMYLFIHGACQGLGMVEVLKIIIYNSIGVSLWNINYFEFSLKKNCIYTSIFKMIMCHNCNFLGLIIFLMISSLFFGGPHFSFDFLNIRETMFPAKSSVTVICLLPVQCT